MELLPRRPCDRHLAALAIASVIGGCGYPWLGGEESCGDEVPDPPPGSAEIGVCPGYEHTEPQLSGGCQLSGCYAASGTGCREWHIEQVGGEIECTIVVDLGYGETWTETGRWQKHGCGETPDYLAGIDSIGEEPVPGNKHGRRCPPH